jgi:hypothetical protein
MVWHCSFGTPWEQCQPMSNIVSGTAAFVNKSEEALLNKLAAVFSNMIFSLTLNPYMG